MLEQLLPFRFVSFDSSNKVRLSVWFKKTERGYFPPHPEKGVHFMVEISGVKRASLLQSCVRKLTDLNIDKCSCLVFVTLGNSHKYLYQKLQSILAVMPSGSCKYHLDVDKRDLFVLYQLELSMCLSLPRTLLGHQLQSCFTTHDYDAALRSVHL